ncbi:MAG: formate dehydrogenase [Desulfobulbaceae bacterium DB1]|nr:MAG: formate dehydrogenase [Desulfobulbaceae bacterium DB1]
MSNTIAGIEDNEVLLVIGSNTTEAHPVIAVRMMHAVKKGAKLLVADPRAIELTKSARLWLRHRPGSDAALINAMCHVIIRDDLHDKNYIEERTENFAGLQEAVSLCTPEWAEKITGVPAHDIEEAARIYAAAERAGIYYTMGITQHTSGTDNVRALANLALLTGNLGKHGAGLNPLRGQNNVQGSSDMGCIPMNLPGYRPVADENARKHFEEIWKTPVPGTPGLTATEMMPAILQGKISGMWIMGENPVLSDPNSEHATRALQKLDFLVVQDIFMTCTAELADVVLPAACFAEKDGTFTNTERRVQRVRRAVCPPGHAMDDLSIINMVTARMVGTVQSMMTRPGRQFNLPGGGKYRVFAPFPEEVFSEIGRCWPHMAGMSHRRLDEQGGLQWPCPSENHPGTPVLFENTFPIGKAKFTEIAWNGPKEVTDAEYPLVLTTGRVLYQYHTGTMTRRSQVLELSAPSPYVEMHPENAGELGLSDGEEVRATSRRGSITLPVRITDRVEAGIVFMPFHYKEAAANLLTNDALDPVCKIPEAKVCAVRIEKVG